MTVTRIETEDERRLREINEAILGWCECPWTEKLLYTVGDHQWVCSTCGLSYECFSPTHSMFRTHGT